MSYVVPSVLVYQQLASNGGVANITPDLEACIMGPCYNLIEYSSASAGALALSAATLTGGGTAIITDPSASNLDVFVPNPKPGQLIDPASLLMYLNNAKVITEATLFTGTIGSGRVDVRNLFITAAATSGTDQITVSGSAGTVYVNDNITIAGAGASGGLYTGKIIAKGVGSTFTVSPNIGTTVTTGAMGRVSFDNVNSVTSTLRVEAGDLVKATDSLGAVFFTTVLNVIGTSTAVTKIDLADVVPSGTTGPYELEFTKIYNNLLIPKVYLTKTNYSDSSLTTTGSVGIKSNMQTSYGIVSYGNVYIEYVALRTDLSTSVLDINNDDDREAVLGPATDRNPLALGVQLALANTVGRIRAIAIKSNDLAGYLDALDLSESTRLHSIVPLTQEDSILAAVQQHTEQMSTPEYANWRMALVNTAIPDVTYIGIYNPDLINTNGGNNTVSLIGSSYVLTSSNSTFVADGVSPGDTIIVDDHTFISGVKIKTLKVMSVMSNQQIVVDIPQALTAVKFYIQRTLTRNQQASYVAAASTTFGSNRVVHMQPDTCGVIVKGVTKYLPGYYLCAAASGLTSGLPAQQGLTNIGLAGIADLSRSNFYFTRAQLNTMAAAGTCLLVQEAAGQIPYFRHSLTTDMTVLQYREVQQVRNIDFLSYFFHDILKGFPGRYNITPDTLQTLRTTINAGGKLLQGKKLPKIGAPLIDFTIKTLKQDENNKDHVIVELPVTFPTVMNYIDLYLIV